MRSPGRQPSNLRSCRPRHGRRQPSHCWLATGRVRTPGRRRSWPWPAVCWAAAAVGGTRAIRLKRGWEEPSVVWSAVVADSGTLKSPAWRKALAPLFRIQKRLLLEYRATAAKYPEELAAYKEAKKKAKEGGA